MESVAICVNVESFGAVSPINGKGLLISSADKWLISAQAPQAIRGERCWKGGTSSCRDPASEGRWRDVGAGRNRSGVPLRNLCAHKDERRHGCRPSDMRNVRVLVRESEWPNLCAKLSFDGHFSKQSLLFFLRHSLRGQRARSACSGCLSVADFVSNGEGFRPIKKPVLSCD